MFAQSMLAKMMGITQILALVYSLSFFSIRVTSTPSPLPTSTPSSLLDEEKITCRASSRGKPTLESADCQRIILEGWERVFQRNTYRLTRRSDPGPYYIQCPYAVSSRNCKLVLDYDDEDPEPPYREIDPRNVASLARALLKECVDGGGPGRGGKIEPVDTNADATLWLLHRNEQPGVGSRSGNGTNVTGPCSMANGETKSAQQKETVEAAR